MKTFDVSILPRATRVNINGLDLGVTQFFELTSLNTRFSSIDSANIFFNLASANSISPNFFFQR